MNAGELINMIPPQTFRNLAVETKVDNQVKKLSGEVIFKLILFSMLNSEKLSLRVMEAFLQSAKFKSFSGFDILDGKYNSLSDRICTINSDYFEQIFKVTFAVFNKELGEQNALSKTDSTCIALTTKLLSEGIEMGSANKKFVKYSVNLKGSIPSSVKVFTEQKYASDELAMKELIDECDSLQGDIVVFDRGLRSRVAFDRFTDSNKLFITRGDSAIRCKDIKEIPLPITKAKNSKVTIVSDQTGFLFGKNTISNHRYRVIKAIIDQSTEPICFITNIMDEEAYTIAAWYKQRWKIEVFFKYIKQHLNVKHLISRNENGIKVMIYMTMILATLIIAYKKINSLKGFKIPKLKFELDLDIEIIKAIVTLCGGDPARAPHLFNSG